MKTVWINFYIRTAITFFIYYLLDSYIKYSFFLDFKLITSFLILIILSSIAFQLKKFSVYLCGIISTSIFLILIFAGIIQIFFLAKNNIGESGFGIFEIICLIPLFIINIVFFTYNCYQYKKKQSHN